jgi:hypothetical protein
LVAPDSAPKSLLSPVSRSNRQRRAALVATVRDELDQP